MADGIESLILSHLQSVAEERARREAAPALAAATVALKQYQQQRFARSYADLLASTRYAAAARFFLEELYGPGDYSLRDAQFARVVPALVRLFPERVVDTVRQLAELHAISEQLDTAMAVELVAQPISAAGYVRAWQRVGRPADRARQIELTLEVGQALDALTRKPMLRQALRMMRGPAQAAGLASLQQFLECGFDTFKAMRGAADFLSTVEQRERQLAQALFAARLMSNDTCPIGDEVLGQLP